MAAANSGLSSVEFEELFHYKPAKDFVSILEEVSTTAVKWSRMPDIPADSYELLFFDTLCRFAVTAEGRTIDGKKRLWCSGVVHWWRCDIFDNRGSLHELFAGAGASLWRARQNAAENWPLVRRRYCDKRA